LRYRPSERTEIEAHAGRLALLAADVADLPVAALRHAIQRWVVSRPYLPKASELVELAREHGRPAPGPVLPLEEQAARKNAALAEAGNFRMRWIIEFDQWRAVEYIDWLERQDDDESRRKVALLRRQREESAYQRLRPAAPHWTDERDD
jgi:hypothetical protein